MKNEGLRKAAEHVKTHRLRKRWQRMVGCLAAVVVFCTVYALMHPAAAMEKEVCQIPEHTHSEACYTQVTSVTKTEPVCTEESLNIHQHTKACLDKNGEPVCGYADFVVHTHDDACYGDDGKLWCPLPETKVHTHGDGCYTTEKTPPVHTHDEECYTMERGELTCTAQEGEGHTHSVENGCFDEDGNLVCQTEESLGHQHTDECYVWEKVLTCELSTEPVQAEQKLVCGKEEIVLHEHTDACFDKNGSLTCGKTQVLEHKHNKDCFQTVEEPVDTEALTCQLEENEEHRHSALCYGVWELTCGQEEHTHTEECRIPVELTEEEQARVETVIALIDALPTQEEIDETLAGFEKAGDEEGYDAYLTKTVTQVKAAYDAYAALTEAQQKKVTNADRLMALEPLWSAQLLPEGNSAGDTTRLYEYAADNGGTVTITISDSKGGLLTANPDTGQYDVTAGETYNVRVSFSGDKLDQGRYYVTFASIQDLEQSKDLVFTDNQGNKINAGSWHFERQEGDTVWLIFDITGDLSAHSDIVLAADVTCKFDYAKEPVTFDGDITVNIKHNEESPNTDVSKWTNGGVNAGKINWHTQIDGNSGSRIIGNTITDTITSTNTHYFSDEDMTAGIAIEAIRYKPESPFTNENVLERHTWTVTPENGLTWTATGWSYTMPETISCTTCGQTVTLGNDDWQYNLRYTSTVKPDLGDGYIRYENKVSIDGDEATARTYTGTVRGTGTVVKDGKYHHVGEGDEEKDNLYSNDTIDWTMTINISGSEETGRYTYGWHLWDQMWVQNGNTSVKWDNPLQNVTVTAVIGRKEYTVPNYDNPDEVTNSDCPICWRNDYSEPYTLEDGSTIHPNQEIAFYTRCVCTEERCANWKDGTCGGKHRNRTYCDCWSITEDTQITFRYSTPAGNLTTAYGGRNAKLVNSVDLNNIQNPNTVPVSAIIDESDDAVTIPGVFTKQLTHPADEKNGYLAEYTITVNEGMADLSSMQDLTIEDTMTTTLGFLPTTFSIQREDAEGNTPELEMGEDKDYTLSYETDVDVGTEKKNKLTIKLNQKALGAYKYTVIYDASVSGSSNGLVYKNDASVTLFGKGQTITGGAVEVPEAVISAQTYGATLRKYDKSTNDPLEGATFQLYAVSMEEGKEDVPLCQYTTGKDGIVQVQTHPSTGVVLHVHVLYCVQEVTAPEGYQLDDTKHYFWFCNNEDDVMCSKSNEYGLQPYEGKCVYSFKTDEKITDLEIANEAVKKGHELPQTGGSGTVPYTTGGLLAIGAGVFLLHKKRRKEDFASS